MKSKRRHAKNDCCAPVTDAKCASVCRGATGRKPLISLAGKAGFSLWPIFLFSFVLALVLLFPVSLNAQIFPPQFKCVKNDTLIWDVPANTCGTFNSYRIFYSNRAGGPYHLLASIAEPDRSQYFHANPGDSTRYYFMTSDYDCPGEPAITSDTLNNLSPEVSRIKRVTVENGEVEISWIPSSSPEVTAHIIYRNTVTGTIPIDTLTMGNDYTDTGAQPGEQSESYFVVALDDCGNNSIFDDPHSTVYLTMAVDSCTQSITLNWNLYQNWPNGIGIQEVWLSLNGNVPIKVATLNPDIISYTYGDANDGEEYCFTVKAIQDGTLVESRSNEVCQVLDIIQPMRNFVITNVSVTPDDHIEINWMWDTGAEINRVQIFRSPSNDGYEEIHTMPVLPPLQPQVRFADEETDPNNGRRYYTLQTTDDCGDVVTSTYGSTLFLTGTSLPSRQSDLSWTELDIENAFLNEYEVFKVVGGNTRAIATSEAGELNYLDPVTAEEAASGNVCYFVVAHYTMALPNGLLANLSSRSNTLCLEQQALLFVPNAFAPRGRNSVFRPVITFGQAAEFEMRIYNRWGEEVFVTDSINQGWDGKVNGNEPKVGTYAYYIKVIQATGSVIERKGVVVLLQ